MSCDNSRKTFTYRAKVFTVLILALSALHLGDTLGAPASQNSADTELWNAFENGNYGKAIMLVQKETQVNPQSDISLYKLGEIYRLTGNPELAIRAYKELQETFPGSDVADDALFRIGRVLELDLDRPAAALAVFSELVRLYPGGSLSLETHLGPHIYLDKDKPLEPFVRYNMHTILWKMHLYQKSLDELTKAIQSLEKYEIPWTGLNKALINDFITKVYKDSGILLVPSYGPIVLTPENETFEETVRTANDFFIMTKPGFHFEEVEATLSGNPLTKTLGLGYESWVHLKPDVGTIDGNIRSLSFEMKPWSPFFSLYVPDSKGLPSAALLRLKAQVVKNKSTGVLRINANKNVYLTIDPPAIIPNKPDVSWNKISWGVGPSVIWNIPAGIHEIRIYASGDKGGWGLSGEEDIRKVEIFPDRTTTISKEFDMGLPDRRAPEYALPGWDHFSCIQSGLNSNYSSRPGEIQLLQTRDTGLILLWLDAEDLWISTSKDTKTWSSPSRLPTPINSLEQEYRFHMSIDADDTYWLVFNSARRGQSRIFISHSKDLRNWSRPKAIAGPKGNLNFAFVISQSGEFYLYQLQQLKKNYLLKLWTSGDGTEWTDKGFVFEHDSLLVFQVLQGRNRLFYLLMLTTDKATKRSNFLLSSSSDGNHWSTPSLLPVVENQTAQNPILLSDEENNLMLGWFRPHRLAFSVQRNSYWSQPHPGGNMGTNYLELFPSETFSWMRDLSGIFRIAYVDSHRQGARNLCVGSSRHPFCESCFD